MNNPYEHKKTFNSKYERVDGYLIAESPKGVVIVPWYDYVLIPNTLTIWTGALPLETAEEALSTFAALIDYSNDLRKGCQKKYTEKNLEVIKLKKLNDDFAQRLAKLYIFASSLQDQDLKKRLIKIAHGR